MRGWVRWIIAGCIITSATSGWAIIRRDDVPDSVILALGLTEPAVGRLDLSAGDRRSVVLIRDRWIMTAGHNFASATGSYPVQLGGQTYTATNWKRHGLYTTNLAAGYDFSIAELDRRVTNVAPIPLATSNIGAGQVGTFVGYGAFGTGTTGQGSGDFQVRMGTNVLEWSTDLPNCLIADFDSGNAVDNTVPGSSPTQTQYECTFGNGDSGGAVFVGPPGNRTLVGIMSFRYRYDSLSGLFNFTRYSSCMGASRADLGRSWVTNNATKPGIVSGRVTTPGYSGALNNEQVVVQLRDVATGQIVSETTQSLNPTGDFSFSTSSRGTHDVLIRMKDKSLVAKVPNIVIGNTNEARNNDVTLLLGDADGDNMVSILDYLALSAAFGKESGGQGFDTRVDFDGDRIISILDYLILSANFGLEGQL